MKNTNFIFNGRPPIERIREKMKAQRDSGMPYSQIAHHWGVSKGTAWRIVKHGYEPKQADIREALRLPELITVPAYRDQKGRFTKELSGGKR